MEISKGRIPFSNPWISCHHMVPCYHLLYHKVQRRIWRISFHNLTHWVRIWISKWGLDEDQSKLIQGERNWGKAKIRLSLNPLWKSKFKRFCETCSLWPTVVPWEELRVRCLTSVASRAARQPFPDYLDSRLISFLTREIDHFNVTNVTKPSPEMPIWKGTFWSIMRAKEQLVNQLIVTSVMAPLQTNIC